MQKSIRPIDSIPACFIDQNNQNAASTVFTINNQTPSQLGPQKPGQHSLMVLYIVRNFAHLKEKYTNFRSWVIELKSNIGHCALLFSKATVDNLLKSLYIVSKLQQNIFPYLCLFHIPHLVVYLWLSVTVLVRKQVCDLYTKM